MRRTDPRFGRRRLLATLGTAAAVGLAGCSGSGDGDSGGGDGDGSDGNENTPTSTSTPTEASDGVEVPDLEPAGDVVGSEARSRVEEYLSEVGNYEGEIVDATGVDEVVVAVGAEGNGGNFAFEHPAIAVSPGTTVSWQWTGQGGQHNVVSEDPSGFDFDSGSAKTSGDPFEQSFDGGGVGLYVCVPHASLGMKGAVVVVSG
ncbi:MAG: halocyanin domain-containing protein [Haloarculaceae archaeon]